MGHRRITLRDVAIRAAVSTCTVSHVINGTARVLPGTRRRVEKGIRDLNYQPNLLARSLRRRQTKTIGLVVADIDNPFFTKIVRAVQDACLSVGYQVIVCNTDEQTAQEQAAIRTLIGSRVDGIILAPAAGDHAYLDEFSSLRVPIVTINGRLRVPQLPFVVADNEGGANTGTAHLIQAGHRRIGVIVRLAGTSTTEERLRGYKQSLAAHRIRFDPTLVRAGGLTVAGGYRAVCRLMNRPTPPTALFGFSNVMAEGAMLALRDLKLACPDKVALIGFDDFRSSAALAPSLTVIESPTKAMGEKAVSVLLRSIAGDPATQRGVILPTAFIHRASCGCNSPEPAEEEAWRRRILSECTNRRTTSPDSIVHPRRPFAATQGGGTVTRGGGEGGSVPPI